MKQYIIEMIVLSAILISVAYCGVDAMNKLNSMNITNIIQGSK